MQPTQQLSRRCHAYQLVPADPPPHVRLLKRDQLRARAVADAAAALMQAKALDGVIRDVNARFGKGSLMRMSATPEKV